MTINPVNLRNTAWILALIFAVYGVFLIVTMFAFAGAPFPLEMILMAFVLGGSYVSGLLIGKKWPLTGGIMSLILPITAAISMVYTLFRLESKSSGYMVGSSLIMFLFMMIPGVLYLLSWYLQRKIDQSHSIGERSK